MLVSLMIMTITTFDIGVKEILVGAEAGKTP